MEMFCQTWAYDSECCPIINCDVNSSVVGSSLQFGTWQNVTRCFRTTPQPFYGPFSRTTQVSQCQKRNFWTLWRKGRLTEADTLTIRLGTIPSGLTTAHLHYPSLMLQNMAEFGVWQMQLPHLFLGDIYLPCNRVNTLYLHVLNLHWAKTSHRDNSYLNDTIKRPHTLTPFLQRCTS